MAEKIVFTDNPQPGEPWDVAIIGSGPAALTAAIYTTRGAASTIIFAGDAWGGQLMLTTTVDNFPGFPEGIQGPDLMENMRVQAERFGAEVVDARVTEVDFTNEFKRIFAEGKEFTAKTVIVATGADTKWLEIPGEDRFRGRGVSSCAPCDAPFFKDKSVAVVGGGDSAMEEALVLTKYASVVTLIHRREEFKASAAMQKRVFESPKINLLMNTEVTEVKGEQAVQKILLKTDAKSKQAHELRETQFAAFKGILSEEKEGCIWWEMPIDGLFVAIGHSPATEIFRGKLELDEKGYVLAHDRTKTSLENGVFVAGDVQDYSYRQAITAAGFGCMAGMDTLKFLDKPTPNW